MASLYPSFGDGLRVVIDWIDQHRGMWPAAAFAAICLPDPDRPNEPKDTLAVHMQLLTEEESSRSKATLTNPLAINGVTDVGTFRQMLHNWASGARGEVEGWRLLPPRINSINWESDSVVSEHYPLMRELPKADSRYREARAVGHGDQLDVELHNWLSRQAQELNPNRYHPQLFSTDYLGGANWAFGSYYMLLHLPLAVALKTGYDSGNRFLLVNVGYRPPLTMDQFEVRVGDGLFDASRTPVLLIEEEPSPTGWLGLGAAENWEPGVPAKVWLTLVGSESSFGWEASVDTGRADTPTLRRERSLEDWYRLSRRDLADDLAIRGAGMGKGDSPAAAFEVALANVLGALGFSVFMGGGPMQTTGVDLLAFDPEAGRAYAISATISNDLDKKLTTWANAEREVRAALEPVWDVRPVIVTTQPWDACIEPHVHACHERGVLVRTAEHLEPLKEEIPDLATFRAFLAEDPPRIDPPGGRRFRRYGLP